MILKNIAEKLARQARNSISDHCYECKALCCRSEHLLLTEKEAVGMMKMDLSELRKLEVPKEDKYIFNLGSSSCPNLRNYRCNIHKNPDRPKACKEFPLFIWKNNTIMVSFKCPAAKENKLYPFLAKFKALGYKLVYSQE